RERIRGMIADKPRLRSVDAALHDGSWRLVALLRMTPLVPFNVQNYIYGISSLRFVVVMMATVVFMLPGIFVSVYIGHLGRQGALQNADVGAGVWLLRVGGLIAVTAAVWYITRLTRRAMARQLQTPADTLPGTS